jgi:hypothetical protein
MEEAFMENRELTEFEIESVSGGVFRLDFGIVFIDFNFGYCPN